MVEILLVFLCRHLIIYPNITYYSIYKNFRVIVIFFPQNLYISKKSGIFAVETLKTTKHYEKVKFR